MKNVWFNSLTLLLIMALLFTAGCNRGSNESETEPVGGQAKGEQTYTFKLGFNTVEDSVRGAVAHAFRDIVEERTNSRVKIEIFPSEALGSEQEMVEALQVGALDFQLMGGGQLSNVIPEYGLLGLPFIVQDFEEVHALLDGPIGDDLKQLAEEKMNIKVLSFSDLGFAQVTNNVRPINTPADLKGIKMRAPNEPMLINTFRQLGASVSTMPFSEVYLGLSQGAIDGQFNPLDAIYEAKFHEVQDYLTVLNLFYYPINFGMSKQVWDTLDPELQNIIQEAADVAKHAGREYAREMQESMVETMKPHFKEITYPDTVAFREKVQPLYDEAREAGLPVDDFMEFLEEYRSKTK